jgi:hypothetical protein
MVKEEIIIVNYNPDTYWEPTNLRKTLEAKKSNENK